VAATMTDDTGSLTNDPNFYFLFDYLPMNLGVKYHVTLSHAAYETGLTATMSDSDGIYSTMSNVYAGSITDFRLDTLSISSYQDTNNLLLAQGTVGNIVVTLPPVGRNCFDAGFTNGIWQVETGTYPNWNYTLERSTNLVSWSDASPTMSGNGNVMTLSDGQPPAGQAFYRVRASQP
jgi:hypothetical protein